ncbi:DMP19 family protein [Tenggerimyces flavus]|uniref:DNA mimic protein DMP19 C-terminal domain-containing protein n=1 Tax=Tenggerimyces flavus TaxID=1708749 RepID=A0ABV7YIB9_9ACTN|nr:hypothetical protein [Tenggerimyces flavus]MBM7783878.1 hypothetical protein [Tenggerimyces flavus]
MVEAIERELFDRVWSLACAADAGVGLAGDDGLRAVLAFHGLTMNGGLSHSCSVGADLAPAAIAALRAYGLIELADVVAEAVALSDDPEQEERVEELDDTYNELLPTDQHLVDAAFTYWRHHRAAFAEPGNSRPLRPRPGSA